ncbi:FliO/MopB family protein [Homoserinimonas aerilata]|uniref:FliO/MopB family protein n=1 Tax=Homoserinimonas aerilata TaxID=1162970 RepID=UPI001151C33F|nr:flagellar biosynthetic protein FliO [Homoserinimonas aerilata]
MEDLFVALRVAVSLAAVLALVWWLHRRLTRGVKRPSAKAVTVVTRQSLGQKASLVVVDVEGSRLVLGVTEHGVSVLQSAEMPEPVLESVPALDSEEKPSFARSLGQAQSDAGALRVVKPLFTQDGSEASRSAASGALAGSILSPQTWKQAAATLRKAL